MDKISLNANPRTILGKKVKRLRSEGLIPAHVFGNKIDTEHISVIAKEFSKIYHLAGETGLIDLIIAQGNIKPVLIRDVQYDPRTDQPLNIDFYQVNLKQKVTVPVPIVLIGDEPESVHMGETVVLQPVAELNVEALPTDLVENIKVDISILKNVDDAITVSQLNFDRDKLTVLAEEDEVVVKLAPAVTEEMKALMEEQAAEQAAAQAEVAEEAAEAEAGEEGEAKEAEGGEAGVGEATDAGESQTEDGEEGKEAAEEKKTEEKTG